MHTVFEIIARSIRQLHPKQVPSTARVMWRLTAACFVVIGLLPRPVVARVEPLGAVHITAKMHLQPGPMIPARVPSIVVHTHAGGGTGHSTFRGISVSVSFSARDDMRKARRLIHSGHPTKALNIYQRVLSQYGDHLIRVGHSRYISIRAYVWRTLYHSSVIKNGLYDEIYGLEAHKVIAAAQATGGADAVISACNRYLLSSAAVKALMQLSDRFFEAGHFSQALDIDRRLLPNPTARKRRAALLFRSAVTAAAAGRSQLAARYAKYLQQQYATASGVVSGRRQNLAKALTEILKQPVTRIHARTVYSADIPAQAGAMQSLGSAPNTVLWNRAVKGLVFRMPSNAVASQMMVNSISMALGTFGLNAGHVLSAQQARQLMYIFPRISHGVLYIDTLGTIRALNVNSGYTRWAYPQVAEVSNTESIANLVFLAQGADQIYCSVRRGRVFGLMTRHPPSRQMGSPFPVNPMFAYMNALPKYDVVCLNAADGELLWRQSSRKLDGVAVSSPLVTTHGVFILMADRHGSAQQARLSLVKLNERTGAVKWNRYLCTISGQAFQNPNLNVVPTAGHSRIYIATNAGADMAVSQRGGRICWLNLTIDPTPASNNPFGYGPPSLRVLPWRLNPPILTRRRLITAVSGAHRIWRINVYRRRSGRRQLAFAPPGQYGSDILVAVVNNKIILTGASTTAWSETTGKILWKSSVTGLRMVARPTVTDRELYLPTRHYLFGESTRTGRLLLRRPWPTDQTGQAGEPGNLLAGLHGVIAVNDSTIYSYARWKDALAYLNARIKRAPGNPHNYLTLAEAAYASGHWSRCRKSLKQSLAVAKKSKSNASTFTTLFGAAMNFANRSAAGGPQGKPGYVAFFYSVAAASASTPHQEAAWRFAQSNYLLHQHHPGHALALCQQILLNRTLRNTPLTIDGNALPAKAVLPAYVQLRIIAPYGAALYQPWAHQANARIASAADSAAQLADVAYGYPNSSAAPIAAKALLHLLINQQHWTVAYRTALLALAGVPGAVPPQDAKLCLADALLHMRYSRQAYVVAHNTLQDTHLTPPQRSELSAIAASALKHLGRAVPELTFTAQSSYRISPPVRGRLLVPAQLQPRWRSHESVLIATHHAAILRQMLPDGRLAPWQVHLGAGRGRIALLGSHASQSILITPRYVLAVNTRLGTTIWRSSFTKLSRRTQHLARHGSFVEHHVIEPFVAQNGNNRVYINGMLQNAPAIGSAGPLLSLMTRIARFTGPVKFTFIRWTRCGLLVDINHRIMLADPRTGKWLWQRPLTIANSGRVTSARCVGGSIVIALGRHFHRLLAVNAITGHMQARLLLTSAAGYQQMLTGPDATIFLVGHRRTSAYRVLHSRINRLWSRKTSNALPRLSALMFVGVALFQRDGVICLNAATGATRWQIAVLPGAISGIAGKDMDLQTFDDTLIARTPTDLTAYSAEGGHIRWRADMMTRETPPLVRMQLADPDLALLACGPTRIASRSEKLILINQRDRLGRLDNGAIALSKPLVISANNGNGPVIQAWYVLDNSIVFSLHGRLFAYHAGP